MQLPLQNQVSSLELSKQLKELGVKQESVFYWSKGIGKERLYLSKPADFNLSWIPSYDTSDCKVKYSAFTVAELGEMLPKKIILKNFIGIPATNLVLWWDMTEIYACIGYRKFEDKGRDILNKGTIITRKYGDIPLSDMAKSEANARAKMLIYLLENKLIKL